MILRSLDKFSLLGMGFGMALMLQPWWMPGFQLGFFVTLLSTVLQIFTSHVV
jgi:hypothetical protein